MNLVKLAGLIVVVSVLGNPMLAGGTGGGGGHPRLVEGMGHPGHGGGEPVLIAVM